MDIEEDDVENEIKDGGEPRSSTLLLEGEGLFVRPLPRPPPRPLVREPGTGQVEDMESCLVEWGSTSCALLGGSDDLSAFNASIFGGRADESLMRLAAAAPLSRF